MYSFYFFLLSHRVEGTQKSVSLDSARFRGSQEERRSGGGTGYKRQRLSVGSHRPTGCTGLLNQKAEQLLSAGCLLQCEKPLSHAPSGSAVSWHGLIFHSLFLWKQTKKRTSQETPRWSASPITMSPTCSKAVEFKPMASAHQRSPVVTSGVPMCCEEMAPPNCVWKHHQSVSCWAKTKVSGNELPRLVDGAEDRFPFLEDVLRDVLPAGRSFPFWKAGRNY